MDRSCPMYGTKLKPTCGTDLGTKWEKEARTAGGDMEEDGERESAEMKLISWATATAVAKDRDKWRQLSPGPIPHLGEKELS